MTARLVTACLLGLGLACAGGPGDAPIRATLTLEEALGAGDTAGYARALEPRPFVFPADHGPHAEFATEWWYFTGNLATAGGRRFGYQLTVFRSALAPARDTTQRWSAWATRQAYMAHFAVTDGGAGEFHAFDRFARGAVGLAGATDAPFRVWLEDWVVMSDDTAASSPSAGADARSIFPLRVRAAQEGAALDLLLDAGKPIVLQGDLGLSAKGPEPGNASHYYSFTRMPTRGTIALAGDRFDVTGTSWWDREWSTSALGDSLAGWDWFALQLDDSTEVMAYVLRTVRGGTDPFSAGTFVDARGTPQALSVEDLAVDVLGAWASPLDGTRYPSGWRLRIPRLAIDLTVEPLLQEQELNLAVRYWEGAVDVHGTRDGTAVSGRGYVELTGYSPGTELPVRHGR